MISCHSFFQFKALKCTRKVPAVGLRVRLNTLIPRDTKIAFLTLKDVRAHCYCASLVRTLFIGHARATSFSSARTESKTQQNIELMTFALTWCANIFVGRSVTPTFFFARSLPFLTLSIILKNKKNLCVGSFNYFSYSF